MIAGIDTKGEVYYSLVQANSNSQVMGIFFHHLVAKLDGLRPSWRLETQVLLDNAPYHRSAATLKLL